MVSPKELHLKDARKALKQALAVLEDVNTDTLTLQELKNGAKQAEQAVAAMYRLLGSLESELETPIDRLKVQMYKAFQAIDAPVDLGNFTQKTREIMLQCPAKTMGELINLSRIELLALPGASDSMINEIQELLGHYGLTLGMFVPKWRPYPL